MLWLHFKGASMSSILIHVQSMLQTLQLKCPIFFSGVGEEITGGTKKSEHNVIDQNDVNKENLAPKPSKLSIISYCISNRWRWINKAAPDVPWPPKVAWKKQQQNKWAQWCTLTGLRDLSLHYKVLCTIHSFHCSHRDAQPCQEAAMDAGWLHALGYFPASLMSPLAQLFPQFKLIVLMCKVDCD